MPYAMMSWHLTPRTSHSGSQFNDTSPANGQLHQPYKSDLLNDQGQITISPPEPPKVIISFPGYHSTLNRLLFLMRSPYRMKTKGMGIMATAMNPSTEVPQPRPKDSYMAGPASGNKAPNRDRNTVLAARADAEYMV